MSSNLSCNALKCPISRCTGHTQRIVCECIVFVCGRKMTAYRTNYSDTPPFPTLWPCAHQGNARSMHWASYAWLVLLSIGFSLPWKAHPDAPSRPASPGSSLHAPCRASPGFDFHAAGARAGQRVTPWHQRHNGWPKKKRGDLRRPVPFSLNRRLTV